MILPLYLVTMETMLYVFTISGAALLFFAIFFFIVFFVGKHKQKKREQKR